MNKRSALVVFLVVFAVTLSGLTAYHFWPRPQAMVMNGGFFSEVKKIGGKNYLVPPEQILNSGVKAADVPAIANPTFDSVALADTYLNDDTYGVSMLVDGVWKYYPVQVLNWHYVVHDKSTQGAFSVSYCVFCHSVKVFTQDDLVASGWLYNDNMLLQDSKGNLIDQLSGFVVRGPDAGSQLNSKDGFEMVPWKDWRKAHNDGQVLSRTTGFSRDYERHPYGAYDANDMVYFPLNFVDDRAPKKWMVDGYTVEVAGKAQGEAIAYVRKVMLGFGVANTVVGDQNIVGLYNFDIGETHAFYAIVPAENAAGHSGEKLTFKFDFAKKLITDEQTSSTWNVYGQAIDGALKGTKMNALQNRTESFWMCWISHFPNSFTPNLPERK